MEWFTQSFSIPTDVQHFAISHKLMKSGYASLLLAISNFLLLVKCYA